MIFRVWSIMFGPPIIQTILSLFWFEISSIASHRFPLMWVSASGKFFFLFVANTFVLFGSGQGIRGSSHVFEPITTMLFEVFFLNHFKSYRFFGQGIVPFLLTPPLSSQAKIALIIKSFSPLLVGFRLDLLTLRPPYIDHQALYIF